MGSIQLGNNIAAKRKAKGITQEELAGHLGVSKPAVSKWESGQSYPDIMLLPVLAAYFDISVDELIGYEPQMEAEDIQKLYRRLADAFVKEPFGKIYEECQEYLKKYYSCWRLQYQMGVLLVNHAALAGDPDKVIGILKEALDIFVRVEKESGDVSLAKQSVMLQGACYLFLNQPAQVIDLLEHFDEPFMSSGALLVKAYQMKGDKGKAIEILQGNTYFNLMNMLDAGCDFIQLNDDDLPRMEDNYKRFLELGKAFDVEQMHPYVICKLHLTAALTFAAKGEKEKSLDAIEAYLGLMKHIEFKIKGNDFFNSVEKYLSTLDIDNHAPRNEEAIQKDLRNIIIANPAFSILETEERFQRIKQRLESKE